MTTSEILASLHDGQLYGIRNAEGRSLTLCCRRVDGAEVVITITGVDDLCATNFRTGNIILFAEAFPDAGRLDDAMLRSLAQSDRKELVAAYMDRLKRAEKKSKFFVVQSSYGCDLVAVFSGEVDVELPTK